MAHYSRRAYLGVVATGVLAGAAGCLGDDDDDETPDPPELDEGPIPAYAEWLPSTAFDETRESMFAHVDATALLADWPQAAIDEFQLEQLAADLGFDLDDLDGFLFSELEDDPVPQEHSAFFGSFEPSAIAEAIAPIDMWEEHDDLLVLEDEVAVGPDALLLTPDWSRFHDAKHAGEDRAIDVIDDHERTHRLIGEAGIAAIETDPDEPWDRLALAMTAEAEQLRIFGYLFYPDEDTAIDDMDDAEDDIRDELEEGEIVDVTRHDTIIVVEATADFVDFF